MRAAVAAVATLVALLATPAVLANHPHDFGGGVCVNGYALSANAENDYHYPLFDLYFGVIVNGDDVETFGNDAQYRVRCCAIANQAWYCYL